MLLMWQRTQRTASTEAAPALEVEIRLTADAAAADNVQATRDAGSAGHVGGRGGGAPSRSTATAIALATRYARGIAAADVGDWTRALLEFSAVFEADPSFADVENRLSAAMAALTPTPTHTVVPGTDDTDPHLSHGHAVVDLHADLHAAAHPDTRAAHGRGRPCPVRPRRRGR
ncbi:MAG: hypothetical protein R3A10_01720 [Caldilineaceae bacterium]